ncbi:CHAT domain-containing protein [Lactarius akahatsu]|uniref:CHAT domain-containing protein n=1 Tax=Lactarius akahatsu TaxID=416441 RepID=A0AAD4LHD7_9AGAM|nr:CHAT domain-containing protein [Lactarius akahatsu]
MSSRSDPRRLSAILGLATTRLRRYMQSNQREDLDKAILHLTESILLPPSSWLEQGPMILTALFFLGLAFSKRLMMFNQLEDAIYATNYLRHLRDQPQAAFACPRHAITTLLLNVLALRVKLEASNIVQNIEEMATLCHELLASDASEYDTTHSVTLFSGLVLSKIHLWLPDRPLDKVIKCLRTARMHKPDHRQAHFSLAVSLGTHYYMTSANDDYEKAASVLDEIITFNPPGDSQGEFRGTRSATHESPEYLEEAIYRNRAFLASPSVKEPFGPATAFDLERAAKQRFRYFGSIEGSEASSSGSPSCQPVPGVSFGEYEGGDPEFSRIHKNMEFLGGLLSEIRNNDATKIDETIEKGRTILASTTPGDPIASCLFEFFGFILFEAFKRTNKIEYLNESIKTRRQVFERPLPQFLRFTTLHRLAQSLLTRSMSFPGHRTQDPEEALEMLSQCVNDGHANLPDRFHLARLWASFARGFRHPSVSTAYETAMSLMQDNLLLAPTLQLQHATLTTSDLTHSMPLDYASFQVDLHRFKEAVETLERGRALLWTEMRHLRANVDQLTKADPDLGRKFAAVGRDLEELTKSVPPSHKLSIDDGAADDLRAVDPFGRLLLKQRKLMKERDNLISQIQALPGFDCFLTSPSFDTLRSAASSGPVIIINHSTWRSDILILLHNTSPSLIPTPHDFYDRANVLKDRLLYSRHKYGLDSSHYDETLASVLEELYKLVGKPVINRLRQLNIPEQSRGPIPSDDGVVRYFLDLYICSYTPTLSALIQSRNRDSGSRSSDRPSILLVAQPDPSLPTVGGEIQVVRGLNTEVTSLISKAATPAAVIDGFHHNRFVHFACHGTLEAGKPFEAGFELYGDKRLTLLEIVRSDLPTAEFAFLSACHTAEVTEGSVIDEGLHLAAAVQYCGFRSVVGTMWAMVDEDGRDLAEHFYKALFSNSGCVPYYERSAKALRVAVKKLRRKRRITLERWVNFVHYGA